jgi:putative Holliday junction resolvase
MRKGRRMGVDVGTVRIGVAESDPDGLIATPVATIQVSKDCLEELNQLLQEIGAIEIVVGLPTSLSGAEGEAAAKAREFSMKMHNQISTPIRLVDERLSTVVASNAMRASGVNSKKGRVNIDQAAAVVILQAALDSERTTGRPPGELVI